MNADTGRPTRTEPATWVKALSVFLGIPLVLWLAVLGTQGVRSYSGLVTSIDTLQQDITHGIQELKKQQTGKLPANPVTSSEAQEEYSKLEQRLAELQPLYTQLEQQIAHLQTLYSQVEKQMVELRRLSVESRTEAKEERDTNTTRTTAQEVEPPPMLIASTQPTATAPARYELGTQGPEVRRIQQRLQELGHYKGTVDGIFNPETQTAVQTYQRSLGLSADGVVGRRTFRQLTDKGAAIAASTTEETQSDTDQTQTIRYTWWAKGPEVERIQKRLQELGHYTGTVDSNFGRTTRKAVKAFQKSQGLPADGMIGPETFQRLFPDN